MQRQRDSRGCGASTASSGIRGRLRRRRAAGGVRDGTDALLWCPGDLLPAVCWLQCLVLCCCALVSLSHLAAIRWISFGALQVAANWSAIMADVTMYQGRHSVIERQIITSVPLHCILNKSFESRIIDDGGVHWAPIKAWTPEHAKALTVPQVSGER